MCKTVVTVHKSDLPCADYLQFGSCRFQGNCIFRHERVKVDFFRVLRSLEKYIVRDRCGPNRAKQRKASVAVSDDSGRSAELDAFMHSMESKMEDLQQMVRNAESKREKPSTVLADPLQADTHEPKAANVETHEPTANTELKADEIEELRIEEDDGDEETDSGDDSDALDELRPLLARTSLALMLADRVRATVDDIVVDNLTLELGHPPAGILLDGTPWLVHLVKFAYLAWDIPLD
eukprot:NODE_2544_length_1038_cov_141.057080_g2526_i0.p1 GENE.NODE_2544_length_1038_cov_141.057080_g2526_i0~~NODE_2544_length_1038_cov_141.057080_g2526_i0.p1  ORF type:complete len:236 (-),score=32.59 NODE_2544_length_1038_cov_141.057080_g2526_i0:236-943(-)